MFDLTDVNHVRNDIQRIIGSTVQLETNKGRHKAVVSKGIVSNVYPSIFTRSASGVDMGVRPKFSTSAFSMFGETNAGRLGPR